MIKQKTADIITNISMRYYKGPEVFRILDIGIKIREYYLKNKPDLKKIMSLSDSEFETKVKEMI
jgi:hypothetical protein